MYVPSFPFFTAQNLCPSFGWLLGKWSSVPEKIWSMKSWLVYSRIELLFSEKKKKKKGKKSLTCGMCTCYGHVMEAQTSKETLSAHPPPSKAPICSTLYIVRGGARPAQACSATADRVRSKTQISPNVSTTGHLTGQVAHDICLIFCSIFKGAICSFGEEIHVNEVLTRSHAGHRGRINSPEHCLKQREVAGSPKYSMKLCSPLRSFFLFSLFIFS